jgi:hypothetical protein
MKNAAWLLFLVSGSVFAGETTITWPNPTTYDNGIPFAPEDIVSHRIQWTGRCPGFEYVAPANNIIVAGNAESHHFDNITTGYRCFRVFVTVRDPRCTVSETETCLVESDPSPVWGRNFVDSFPPRKPAAPSALTGT